MASRRNTVLAVGPETDVSRFESFMVDEEMTFAELFGTGVVRRGVGWVRLEMMSKWTSPLELLADVSRQFPALRFAVEWDTTDDGPCGCATIADGLGEVVNFEKPVGGELDEDVPLRWDLIRETSYLLFGSDWEDIYRHCDEPRRAYAKQLARRSVAERSDLAEEIRRLQQDKQDLLSIALMSSQGGVSKAPSSPPTSDEVLSMVNRKENSTYIIEPVYRNRKQTGEYRACRTPKNWPTTPSWEFTKDVPWETVLPNEEELEKWLKSVKAKPGR